MVTRHEIPQQLTRDIFDNLDIVVVALHMSEPMNPRLLVHSSGYSEGVHNDAGTIGYRLNSHETESTRIDCAFSTNIFQSAVFQREGARVQRLSISRRRVITFSHGVFLLGRFDETYESLLWRREREERLRDYETRFLYDLVNNRYGYGEHSPGRHGRRQPEENNAENNEMNAQQQRRRRRRRGQRQNQRRQQGQEHGNMRFERHHNRRSNARRQRHGNR